MPKKSVGPEKDSAYNGLTPNDAELREHEMPDWVDRDTMMPISVSILTADHEIHGIIFVSRQTREERRISELLNNTQRRFLAVVDAELVSRTNPSSVRHYAFMELHIDSIRMLHPSAQSMTKRVSYSQEQTERFNTVRQKLRR